MFDIHAYIRRMFWLLRSRIDQTEMINAVPLFAMGLYMMVSPDLFNSPYYSMFKASNLDEIGIGLLFGITGLLNILRLIMPFRISVYATITVQALAVFCWMYLCLDVSLVVPPPLSLIVYVNIALSSMISLFRTPK